MSKNRTEADNHVNHMHHVFNLSRSCSTGRWNLQVIKYFSVIADSKIKWMKEQNVTDGEKVRVLNHCRQFKGVTSVSLNTRSCEKSDFTEM